MALQNFYDNIDFLVSNFRGQDIIDIILVWIIVYRVLVLIRTTGTLQMLSGLGILAIVYLSSIWFELLTINWILEKFFGNLFLIVVVLFQGEIRRALAHIGSNPLITGMSGVQDTQIVEEISKTAQILAQRGFGALIVLEKEISLEYFIDEGTEVDAEISSELMISIFDPSSPLHDGAVVIKEGRIQLAGCFLPLSKNPILDKNLGTRHRAALGLTEETDAVVIVISEENKSLSFVHQGKLEPDLDHSQLRKLIYSAFEMKYKGEVAAT